MIGREHFHVMHTILMKKVFNIKLVTFQSNFKIEKEENKEKRKIKWKEDL